MQRFTRENIYSEMLKTVIIRLDFEGSTNIRLFVDRIKQTEMLKSAFSSLISMPKQEYSLSFTPKSIEEGGLPLSTSQRSTVFRFKDCNLQEKGVAILDIDSSSMTITIDCSTDYNGSRKYTDLMSSLMTELFIFDKYITPMRLGIRKIDVQILNDGEKISDYFNHSFAVAKNWNSKRTKRVATLTELSSIDEIKFNEIQRIDKIENGKDRLIFDLDAYIESGYLASVVNKEEVGYIMEQMQNKMFEIFVDVANDRYLEKCKIAKEMRNGQ